MKKYILLLFCFPLFAQVGIGTTNPQETLHLGGTTSTIRIDGLNTANNVLNNGVSTNVVVDAQGNLKLSNNSSNVSILVDSNDIITTNIGLNTPTGALISSTIYTTTINIAFPRLVNIKSSVSADFYKNNAYVPLNDGNARIIGSSLIVNGIVKDKDRESYTNSVTAGAVVGYLYLQNQTYVYLAAGTHTISIEVFVIGSDRTYVEFGGNNDYFQIVQF